MVIKIKEPHYGLCEALCR